jgi:hypothetical protein
VKRNLFHHIAIGFLGASWVLVAVAAPRKPKKVTPNTAHHSPLRPQRRQPHPWVHPLPATMLEQAAWHAEQPATHGLAGLALMYNLSEHTLPGVAEAKLHVLAKKHRTLSTQARWLAHMLHNSSASVPGLIDNWAILGPFQDQGGELSKASFEESDPNAWANQSQSYSWGVYQVQWRSLPVGYGGARGVPLDLFIQPRKETCTYLASVVELKSKEKFRIHVASSGSVRLLWDGSTVATSVEQHLGMVFDRLGGEVTAVPGSHVVAVKVCSGALPDVGRVRVHLERTNGQPLELISSSNLKQLQGKSFPKVQARVWEEPLSALLRLPKKPNPDQALHASIVAVLAGADDSRTQKVSGWLDTVTVPTQVPADSLAMAGWISPFQVVQSGLFQRASDQAAVDKDPLVLGFIQRRWADARMQKGYADWAWTLLQSEPTRSATDRGAEWTRSRIRSAWGGPQVQRASWVQFQKLLASQPKELEPASWQQLIELAHYFGPAQEQKLRDKMAQVVPDTLDDSYVQAAAQHGKQALKKAVNDVLSHQGLNDALQLLNIANLLINQREFQLAEKVLEQGSHWSPNISGFYQKLAAMQALAGKPGPVIQANLQRAHDLAPSDARTKSELAFRFQNKENKKLRDERWLVEPKVFLTRAKNNPYKVGEVVDRELHWLRAVTLHDDLRVSQLIHYAREIVIEPKSSDDLLERVPTQGDRTEILRVRVHRAGGAIAFAEETKVEDGSVVLRWPTLKRGDVIEVAIRSWTSGPIGRKGDAPFYFMDYGGSFSTHPLLFNKVVIDSPTKHPLAVDILHGKAEKITKNVEGNRTVTQYIWEKPVTFPEEPYAPPASEVFPTLVASAFPTWKTFRAWYQSAVQGFTEPDAQITELARKITKGKSTRAAKVQAIFEFVSDDIRYVNYVSGEWWLPNRPQQLLARRQGDCDDKAMLMISLLKAVGIEATEVLIQTRMTGQGSVLQSTKAAIPLFDHGIVFLPGKGGDPDRWLDATSPQSRLGPLPSMDIRAFALFATEGPPVIRPTPVAKPDNYVLNRDWTIQLSKDGSALFQADETHHADSAFFLRSNLREQATRAQWVEQNLIPSWIPQVELDPKVEFFPELTDGASRIKYQAQSGALARKEGNDLVVTLAASAGMASQLAALPKRTLPLMLPMQLAPSKQVTTIRLVAPSGYKPSVLPLDASETAGTFGSYQLKFALDPKQPTTVIIHRTMEINQQVIPVRDYPAWRAWLTRMDSQFRKYVRLIPETPSAQ